MSRPSDVETFMRMAEVAAERSLCAKAQVGAVIVSYEQIVVSTGRNGPPRNFPHNDEQCVSWCSRGMDPTSSPSYSNCPSIHAEANALLTSDRSARVGGTIYVTGEMCFECCKLVANSGLRQVIVLRNDVDYERRMSVVGYNLLRLVGVSVTRYERT